jgi:hypothetical protein
MSRQSEKFLSYVENRQVSDGYTIQFDTQTYRIARSDVRAGLRGANVRIEMRLDASMAVQVVRICECLSGQIRSVLREDPVYYGSRRRRDSGESKSPPATRGRKRAF